jgi:6-phosphofructokinase 1
MRIGVLTGGGDVPGLNAAIRAVVRRATRYDYEVVAIKNGWAGLLGKGDVFPLSAQAVSGILPLGGTVIGASRTNPFQGNRALDKAIAKLAGSSDPTVQTALDGLRKAQLEFVQKNIDDIKKNVKAYALDAIVVIGGRDTLEVAFKVSQLGINVVGVPKTMDNDLVETDYSIGFDSAVTRVMHALDDLRVTAASHRRVIVVETMGRETGWVALVGGLAGGADYIVIPEVPTTVADVCEHVLARQQTGKMFSLIVVSEGAQMPDLPMRSHDETDPFGRPRYDRRAIGESLAIEIERRTGCETRHVILGHLQRGGSPTVFDRVLASRLGVAAVDMVKNFQFGQMATRKNDRFLTVPLARVAAHVQTADKKYYDLAKIFFGQRKLDPGASPIKRIGVLTGGGDCPGLNSAIRAVACRAMEYGWEVIAFKNGWKGLIDEGDAEPLTADAVLGVLSQGGTFIGTSRTNAKKPERIVQVKKNLAKFGIDALVAIGGDDTLGVAAKLHQEGVKVVGVPKTMDNDINETEYTIGFDSACSVVVDALDRLHTTASSHHRVIVVEVMGRDAGWVAVNSGLAGGADFIFIPEVASSIAECSQHLLRRKGLGKTSSIVVVSEGSHIPEIEADDAAAEKRLDEFGHVRLDARGLGERVAKKLEDMSGLETRFVVLGHIQRGGSPSTFDRILATRTGVAAVDLVKEGRFGLMPALQGGQLVPVDLSKAAPPDEKTKVMTHIVDAELYELAKVFF